MSDKARQIRWTTWARGIIVLAYVVLISHRPSPSTAYLTSDFSSVKAPFSLKFHNEVSPFSVVSLFALPGEKLNVSVVSNDVAATYSLSSPAGTWAPRSRTEWNVTAPSKSGLYTTVITESTSNESICLNVFVMVPFDRVKNGMLNGYKIGTYPAPTPSKASLYPRPKGFVEVTQANKNALVSPHLKLGQFLCKQDGNYPKYVVLRERLPIKLEALMEQLGERGLPYTSLSIMSGYRTPYYNRAIGNVKFSRHMWGDAADIFIDSEPRENYMADLNADGVRDQRDGEVLYNILNDLEQNPSFENYVGGLAKYKATKAHGPFVHVDARGTAARWNK